MLVYRFVPWLSTSIQCNTERVEHLFIIEHIQGLINPCHQDLNENLLQDQFKLLQYDNKIYLIHSHDVYGRPRVFQQLMGFENCLKHGQIQMGNVGLEEGQRG